MILCAAMMVGTLQAKVVMTESFEREAGTLNIGINTEMGTNTSDWWSFSGSSNYIKVAEGSMSYPGYKATGAGNKAYLYSSGADDLRQFGTNITSGKVYLAAIVNVETIKTSATADYCLALGDAGASNMYARLYTKSVKEGDVWTGFKFGVAKYSESASYVGVTEETYSANTDYLVVLEYEFVAGEKNDTARLYINPTKETTKATLECVQSAQSGSGAQQGANSKNDASKIGSVNLRQGTNTSFLYIDEIKVTTSWDELFETAAATPVITAEDVVDFGTVNVNEQNNKTLTVKGSNLKGDIAVSVTSAVEAITVDYVSIPKASAESEEGFTLTMALIAANAGEGSATMTLSSNGAEDKTVTLKWNAVAPVSTISIADAKKLADETEVALNDVVVTRIIGSHIYSVQDATGALNIADFYELFGTWQPGDKISGLTGVIIGGEDRVEGFCTILPFTGSVAASSVAVEPFEVTLAELAKYGPAYIQVAGVSFPAEQETFAAGGITITQDAASANLQIPAGCDIIGETVPAKADVKGIVCHPYLSDNILLEKSADLYNRVPKQPTGMESVPSSEGKAQKMLRNGQIVIVKDGKAFNVLGTIDN